jgi:hypothetical protein
MKYFKRLKLYKANNGNCIFNPETGDAHSYRWWRFLAIVDGVVFFNDYRYSSMTTKHQWKVRHLLNELGIKIDVVAPFPKGIPRGRSLKELYTMAEENECDRYISQEAKRIYRNEQAAKRRAQRKAQSLALITHSAHESHASHMQILKLINGGN